MGYLDQEPSEFGAGAYCTSDAGSSAMETDASPDAAGGAFEKPSDKRPYHRKFMEPGSIFATGGASLDIGGRVRPYMLGRKGGTAWLYEDEHFAVDGYLQYIGRDAPKRLTVNLLVLVDSKPVPFHFTYVGGEGGWQPRETFEQLGFNESQEVRLKRRIPYNFTLVIPPEALGDKGVHDVRIVAMDSAEPEPSSREARRTAGLRGLDFTTYVGATAPRHTPSNGEIDIEHVKPTESMYHHIFAGNSLLYPADRREALASDAEDVEPDLGRVIRVNDDSVELEALITGGPFFDGPQKYYYLVLDGSQPVEGLGGLGHPIPPFSDYEDADGPFADRLSFTVDLDDKKLHPISVALFSYPDCRFGFREHRQTRVRVTNTLFVHR